MDTDVVVVRSFDSLLSGDYLAVFGGEEAGNNPCNAVIAARQHSCFICEFHRRMCEKFETNYWGFSLDSLKYAASLKFKGVKLLKRTEGFHPFGWTKSEINEMFNKDLDKTPYSFDKVFSVHLFRRAAIWSGLGVWDRIKNYEWLSTSKSGAAIAFRQALPEGFGPEHLDVEKCIDIPILQ